MLAELFPNVRAGLTHVGNGLSSAKNYLLRKPYGKEKPFITSRTGLDGGLGTRPKLTAEAIRQWDVPALNSKRDGVRWNLHEYAMQRIIRNQPPVQIKSLTEHVLRHGAWGLGEKGASWLAGELSKDSRAREALLDAYTSPEMSSFVTEGSKPGTIRNRAYTNSALVIHGKPIDAGKHLYGSLKNSMLYRGRLDDLVERAKQLDAEAARPAAPAPQAPESPGGLPQPENGRSYTINELMAFSEMFKGHGQPVTITNSPTFTNNPVFNNNNGTGNVIGGHPWPSQQDGYRQYDGQILHDVPTYVDVEDVAGKAAGRKKGERQDTGKKGGKKAGKLANTLLASMALLQMGYALGRRPQPGALAGKVITVYPRVVGKDRSGALASAPRQAAFNVAPTRPLLGSPSGYQLVLRAFLKAHGVSQHSFANYEEPFLGFARNMNYPSFARSVVAHLQSNGVEGKKLDYLKRSGSRVKTSQQQGLLEVYRKAKAV
ncbi:MAG: hypothetical protein WCX64_00205 [Candidatus Micrarchaeia archaeon]